MNHHESYNAEQALELLKRRLNNIKKAEEPTSWQAKTRALIQKITKKED